MEQVWTVYQVHSLLSGGAGQRLTRLGTVEADGYTAALDQACSTFPAAIDETLPHHGLAVIAPRKVE